MLNRGHVMAQQVLSSPDERRIYKTHMCGLCHALGDEYGFISRVITNHEMILLNMLYTAQAPTEIDIVERRCPLNPLMKVTTNQDPGSKVAAAVAVELARISVLDDVLDSGGRDFRARIFERMLAKPHQAAIESLNELECDTSQLATLSDRQVIAESTVIEDPANPSAETSAALFAMTARLAGMPENQEALAEVGANYGRYIYFKDALEDFLMDQDHSNFNPLKRYSKEEDGKLILSRIGLERFAQNLGEIRDAILGRLSQVQFSRNEELITKLLVEPVRLTVAALENLLTQIGDELAFRRFGFADGLKAAAFVMPLAFSPASLHGLPQHCDLVGAEQVDLFNLASASDIFETIVGCLVCAGLGWCAMQSTGSMRVGRQGSGYSVRDETFCDLCTDGAC